MLIASPTPMFKIETYFISVHSVSVSVIEDSVAYFDNDNNHNNGSDSEWA